MPWWFAAYADDAARRLMSSPLQTRSALRDKFAAQAFGPILAFKIAQFGHPCPSVYKDAASAAYEAADIAIAAGATPK